MATIILVCVLAAAGCGSSRNDAAQSGGVAKLRVSVMTTTDVAPIHLAARNGYFREEGLDVTLVTAPTSDASVRKLVDGGEVDVAYSSYMPIFLAEAQGAAERRGGLKLVADASSAAPGSCVVVALPTSSVKSVRDMAGKRVAVTSPNSISALLIRSTLQVNGVDDKTIRWVEVPFPQTADRLRAGDVDAAFLTEPFLTGAHKTVGAVPVFDTATGPTANMATAGWAATGDYVKDNAGAVAGFQRAMAKATNLARSDRSTIEPILEEFSKVDRDTAKISKLLNFESSLDATRLQRVPDLMLQFGEITKKLDVAPMIVPTAPGA